MLKKRESLSPIPINTPFFKTKAYFLNFILLGLQWLTFIVFIKRLPPQVPLWYSLPSGSSQLGNKQDLIFIPIIATLFLITSTFILFAHKSSVAMYTHLIVWLTVLIQALFLIGLLNIISLAL